MSYRMGRGDYIPGYYRGDPGLFGSIGHAISGAAHVIGGAALGFVTGGPLGAIKGAVAGTVAGVKSGIERETLAAGGSGSAYTPAMRLAHAAAVARGPKVASVGLATRGSLHPGMGGLRRRRRMNPGNMKALRRASRRAHAFLRAVKGAVHYFTPKAPKGKAYVHFKKRRAAS